MKKKSLPVTNLGTISLIMIFIVLCMVTFAALSLSSASRDMRAGQNMRAHLEEYYNVSNEAETLLAQADHIFADAYAATADDSEFYRIVSEQTSPFAKASQACRAVSPTGEKGRRRFFLQNTFLAGCPYRYLGRRQYNQTHTIIKVH